MDRIEQLLQNRIEAAEVYPAFASLRPAPELGRLLPAIFDGFEVRALRKDLAYLSLLVNETPQVLESFVEFEAARGLKLTDSTSVYLFGREHGRHWFEAVLRDEVDCDVFDERLRGLIAVTRLLRASNSHEIEVAEVARLLEQVGEVEDEFLKLYVNEVRNILENVKFCKSGRVGEVFKELVRSSLLETYSKYIDLSDGEVWDEVLNRLNFEEARNSQYVYNLQTEASFTSVENFQAFTILFTLSKCLQTSDRTSISKDVATAAATFTSLANFELQLQILQTIFDYATRKTQKTLFELRLLLNFIKDCLDAIRFKQTRQRNFNRLYKDVSEVLWKFEVLCQVKKLREDEDVMRYMLAEPESLIKMCLKSNNFDMARHVIEMFELQATPLVAKIIYTENLNALRLNLTKTHKLLALQQTNPHLTPSSLTTPSKLLTDFFQKKPNYLDLFDIALTLNYPELNLLSLTEEYFKPEGISEGCLRFHDKVIELFGEVEGVSLCEVVCDPRFSFEAEERVRLREFYEALWRVVEEFFDSLAEKGAVGLKDLHASHQSFKGLEEVLRCEGGYLRRLFLYLKVLSRVFVVEGNHADLIAKGRSVSYFEVLRFSRREVLRKLIFHRGLNPRDFEALFKNLKLDLLHHVASSCFPEVRLDNCEVFEVETSLETPVKHVFKFIQRRNWLLAFIISELHGLNEFKEVNENRTKYFTNLINLEQTQNLKLLFKHNQILTVLNKNYAAHFEDYLEKNVFYDAADCPHSDLSFETGEEILEDDVKCNWKSLLEILESIPDFLRFSWTGFEVVRDRILRNLVVDRFEAEHYKFVRFVEDDAVRMDLILGNFQQWPGDFCAEVLRGEVARCDGVEAWLQKIEFCEEIRNFFDLISWYETHELCLNNPEIVLKKLLSMPKVDLLLQFFELFENRLDLLKHHLDFDYLHSVFVYREPLESIAKLLRILPRDQAENHMQNLLKTLKNLEHLQFLLDFLKDSRNVPRNFLRNVQISVNILAIFSPSERDQFWPLLTDPKSIIETLLMNTKFDKLAQICKILNEQLANCEFDEDTSVDVVDELLRKYAEKSLEFRVILQPHPKLLKSNEVQLMESLDSIYGPDQKMFVMPEVVPDKADWVPNNEVLECMCCQNTVFSMFNRRHHCRRCGRIICFNCSTKRMQVDNYGDILVRVCVDCFEQSQADGAWSGDNASGKSIMYDYWLLTNNGPHDAIVRQEFSYEHAPSVSLCLSIMKHHSNSTEYPEFLLRQCESMLKLLQPLAPNSPQEVDYPLVIKMINSLAIAAKMVSGECRLKWGPAQADKILTQVDLLGLLIERGCLNMLPIPLHNGAPYVNWRLLINLRDKLLEMEQWNFALDISTKAALDNSVVFAAWGKSCLKAGCLQLAREKFQRCLDKSIPHDFSEQSTSAELEDSYEGAWPRRRQSSKASTTSEAKPAKNHPLLSGIVEILEGLTARLDVRGQGKKAEPRTALVGGDRDVAVCIKSKLQSLQEVSAGNYEHRKEGQNRQVFLEECVYYLSKYGTHLSLLQFYLKHRQIDRALVHILDNSVSTDVFVEVYLACLKEGVINTLQEGMSAIDSTLDVWKDYLRYICRYLEKQSLLNSLYQLQQFMGDFVRASMTCIKFYKDSAASYRDLLGNIHFLFQAEEHLKQELEQQQWVEVNSVRKLSTGSKNSYEEKALANPSLVMKMDARNVETHIKRIRNQVEVTRFLASDQTGKPEKYIQTTLAAIVPAVSDGCHVAPGQMPTLFDSQHAKIQLAILAILYGKNVKDGFHIAFQIMQTFKLKPVKVYCQAGRQLALEGRHAAIADLVACIRDANDVSPAVTETCDEMLALVVKTLNLANAPHSQLDALIKLMTDKVTKISVYIETKQLKSAYLLAAKYNRFGDIRRILREAELQNKPDIKRLCLRLLQTHSHSHKD